VSAPAEQPQPYSRFVGHRPAADAPVPAPLRLALALREHALSKGLAIGKVERSRVRISGSLYLTMTDHGGRVWIIRVSNHLRPRRTGHPTPHVDLVSFDGVSGAGVGRELINRIVAGEVPWFDPASTVRSLQHSKHRKGKRRCRK
jgi:hypothetical protein